MQRRQKSLEIQSNVSRIHNFLHFSFHSTNKINGGAFFLSSKPVILLFILRISQLLPRYRGVRVEQRRRIFSMDDEFVTESSSSSVEVMNYSLSLSFNFPELSHPPTIHYTLVALFIMMIPKVPPFNENMELCFGHLIKEERIFYWMFLSHCIQLSSRPTKDN